MNEDAENNDGVKDFNVDCNAARSLTELGELLCTAGPRVAKSTCMNWEYKEPKLYYKNKPFEGVEFQELTSYDLKAPYPCLWDCGKNLSGAEYVSFYNLLM
jgi:hypothetical protein